MFNESTGRYDLYTREQLAEVLDIQPEQLNICFGNTRAKPRARIYKADGELAYQTRNVFNGKVQVDFNSIRLIMLILKS